MAPHATDCAITRLNNGRFIVALLHHLIMALALWLLSLDGKAQSLSFSFNPGGVKKFRLK
jgi:hypothetical protein